MRGWSVEDTILLSVMLGTIYAIVAVLSAIGWVEKAAYYRHQCGQAAEGRAALRRAWLAPLWPVALPVIYLPIFARLLATSWREAWGRDPEAEPRRVRRAKVTPGRWKQP